MRIGKTYNGENRGWKERWPRCGQTPRPAKLRRGQIHLSITFDFKKNSPPAPTHVLRPLRPSPPPGSIYTIHVLCKIITLTHHSFHLVSMSAKEQIVSQIAKALTQPWTCTQHQMPLQWTVEQCQKQTQPLVSTHFTYSLFSVFAFLKQPKAG